MLFNHVSCVMLWVHEKSLVEWIYHVWKLLLIVVQVSFRIARTYILVLILCFELGSCCILRTLITINQDLTSVFRLGHRSSHAVELRKHIESHICFGQMRLLRFYYAWKLFKIWTFVNLNYLGWSYVVWVLAVQDLL